jgi:hypothetical protein
VTGNKIIQDDVKQCNCQGEPTKVKENPLILTRRPPLPCEGPKTENTKNNRLAVYLVDVASVDHGHRAFRRVPKQDLEKQTKRNFHETFPRRKPAE